MTQSIAKIEKEQQLSQEDIELVKKTVAAGATESEFKLFLYIAQRYNLDPLVKQIWLIKYGNAPAAIFTSRDGFLSIAHRSGQFDGMDTQAVRGEKGIVTGAICRVWRRDMSHPFTVEVSRSEYDTGKGNWQKMPETMIKKVAESQCLRRAFDISGIYDPSEYDPSENYQEQQRAQPGPAPKSDHNVKVSPVTSTTPIQEPTKQNPLDSSYYKHYSQEFAKCKTVKDLEVTVEVMRIEVTDEDVLALLRKEYVTAQKRLKDASVTAANELEMAFSEGR